MSAHASPDRLGAYWVCTPCIDYGLGFDDLEDAEDAADDHNRVHHRGDNPGADLGCRGRRAREAAAVSRPTFVTCPDCGRLLIGTHDQPHECTPKEKL